VTTPKLPPPAQRPEEFLIMMLVALDDAAVSQDYLRPEQAIRGQAVLAAEDPEPAAQGEAGDPDVRPAACRDG
jgi:hypothetical protein